MKKILLIFLTYLFSQPAAAYQISGQIKDLKATRCYLGHYFAAPNQVIYDDTTKIDSQGKFEFSGNKILPEGLYFIEFPNKKRLDIVIGTAQNFEFITDFLLKNQDISFQNSEENTQYYQYLNFVRHRQAALGTQLSVEQSTNIQQELYGFQTKFFQEKATLLATSIIAATETPFLPAFTLPNGKKDEIKTFYYYKNHLFDNINLTDERLLRTPSIEPKLNEYLEKLTYQIPDSAVRSVDDLLLKVRTPALRKYFISKALTHYQKNIFIGAENVYVHIIDKYYSQEPNLWDAAARQQTMARAEILRPLLLGQTIPNLTATSTDGKQYALHNTAARYTILYIYSLDCSHCQTHAPKIAALQTKMANKGVKIFALAVEHDEAKWRKFIIQYRTQNLLNVIDKNHTINFVKDYNTIEYPTNFVLNAQKQIVGKQINPAKLEEFIAYLEQKK